MSHAIPIISIWDHLLVPLQGDITDEQMFNLSANVLGRIAGKRSADGLVIDASGVWLVDSHLCAALAKLANAARLMGVPTVVCGLNGDVVLTLQAMGLELEGIATSLGLDEALGRLGITVQKRSHHRQEAQ